MALPSPSGVYKCAFIETRSITPRKAFSLPIGICSGITRASENLLQRVQRAFEAGEFAVHPRQNKSARNVVFRAVIPHFFRGDLRADVGINGDQCGIGSDQRGFCFGDKCGIPR